ncbi:hypothetical protein OQA88_12997 [Cercophora sp. LCS_1]
MPTAKKKIGGLGLFSRQADGNSGGPGVLTSPRAAVVGLPATPAPQRELPQLQPPPEIVTARQDLPAALAIRSIPMPKGGRFSSAQPGTASIGLPPTQHFHPMQRTRTSASDTGRGPSRAGQATNAWEDSTVASMFGDNESRAASDRYRGRTVPVPNGSHVRQLSDVTYQPQIQPQSPLVRNSQQLQMKQGESVPFVLAEDGFLTVVAHPAGQGVPTLAPLNLPVKVERTEEPYQQQYQDEPFDTPTKPAPLRRTKFPHRDTREGRRDSATSDVQSLGISPERPTDLGVQLDRLRVEERGHERMRRERERTGLLEARDRDRDLHHKRSTIFENLTPIPPEEPTFDNTRAAVAPTSSNNSSPKSLAELQRTPRTQAPRGPLPKLPPTASGVVSNLSNPLGLTGGNPLVRPGSQRIKEITKQERKRPLSPDYNDAELHAMSYADLKAQAFDFDPQQAALRQQQQSALVVPAGKPLEERLEYYQGTGLPDQKQFFGSLSVDEWEDAGDWFMSQFQSIMKKIKDNRRVKRQMVLSYEVQISEREEQVRGKVEGIAKTLEDLKNEGSTMMQGKDMDLDA